jgi:predicted outer membrane repeat protein
VDERVKLKVWLAVFILLLGIGSTSASGKTIYVDDDVPADFNNIQAAIDDANDGDTVLVADGTYTGPGNRDIDFHGKAITVCSENGPTNCIIDCNGSAIEPHRGLIFQSGEGANSVIQGFTVTSGYADLGAGIKCYLSKPTIINCIFSSNTAGSSGGAIYNIYWPPSYLKIINCTFTNNSAADHGGAIYSIGCFGTAATLRNCIVWKNIPADESGITSGSTPKNCGWPTVEVCYSVLQSDWMDIPTSYAPFVEGEGNIVADPCFADPDANDFHLKSQAGRWGPNSQSWIQDDVSSPAIDAGDPVNPIGFEPFPNGGIINMGAYGGTSEASKSYFGSPLCETIVAGDINGDCRVNFLDFALMAFHWLEDNRE